MTACVRCGGGYHVLRVTTPEGEQKDLCFDCREELEKPLRGPS